MPVQDDARENQMIAMFNLTTPPDRKRSDIDAHLSIDGKVINFELKSSTSGTVSTVRDFGPDHIAKWRAGLHWLFAFYNEEGTKLLYCVYASPADMEPWIAEMEQYIAPDIALTNKLPARVDADDVIDVFGKKDVYSMADAQRLMKKQWTSAQYLEFSDVPFGFTLARMTEVMQQRAHYVITRGSTLNNPHIPKKFFDGIEKITEEHAARLRQLVKDYLNTPSSEDATA